jgi:integrase
MTAETATERGADWEPTAACILCECNCGILGLKWEDIDLEGSRIDVRRSLWRGHLITPKSRRSRRAIDMAPTLKTALARLASRFKAELCSRRRMASQSIPTTS